MFWFIGREPCGILAPPPGIEPATPMHWKAKSQPLDLQGSPTHGVFSCGMRTPSWRHAGSSSLTRDRTQGPCIGSAESQPPDRQGSPRHPFLNPKIGSTYVLVLPVYMRKDHALALECWKQNPTPSFNSWCSVAQLSSWVWGLTSWIVGRNTPDNSESEWIF